MPESNIAIRQTWFQTWGILLGPLPSEYLTEWKELVQELPRDSKPISHVLKLSWLEVPHHIDLAELDSLVSEALMDFSDHPEMLDLPFPERTSDREALPNNHLEDEFFNR